jgi:hypothetical protein
MIEQKEVSIKYKVLWKLFIKHKDYKMGALARNIIKIGVLFTLMMLAAMIFTLGSAV